MRSDSFRYRRPDLFQGLSRDGGMESKIEVTGILRQEMIGMTGPQSYQWKFSTTWKLRIIVKDPLRRLLVWLS